MTKSLEQFEKEVAEKRARLLKDLELISKLPTRGVVVTWIGEGGFEKDGNTRKPDQEYSLELSPYIVHSPFRGHEHVAFQVPDKEYAYSKHRKEFARRYLNALLDACEPYLIGVVSVRGTYASTMPEDYDYQANRDYKDAQEVARGRYELTASNGKGYSALNLEFYIHTADCGTVQVSIGLDRDFPNYQLMARAACDHLGIPLRWSFPSLAEIGAVNLFKRPNADRNEHGVPSGYTLEWVFDTRAKLLEVLGIGSSFQQSPSHASQTSE